ncbi:MAG: hypothetical protein NT067_05540 [Candidatus Diapherotrites archaeon]|nr:hypothetical protein [Candidatus Diapherotrites archaeon]
MELNASEKLKESIGAAEKCIKELEEMRSICKSRSALRDKAVDSAMGDGIEDEKAGKQALGLEKVLESMQERLDRDVIELGKIIGELKESYKKRAESSGIGSLSEAVPE